MSARPLAEDVLLARFWPSVAWIATHGDTAEALEFVREIAEAKDKLHVSIVPNARQLEQQIALKGFSGRPMAARFSGRCAVCALGFGVGASILFDADTRRAAHDACGEAE